jgi:hypothetical protein
MRYSRIDVSTPSIGVRSEAKLYKFRESKIAGFVVAKFVHCKIAKSLELRRSRERSIEISREATN